MRVSCGRRVRLIVVGFLLLAGAATGASLGARSAGGDASSLSRRLDEMGFHYIEGGMPGPKNPADTDFFERMRKMSLIMRKASGIALTLLSGR